MSTSASGELSAPFFASLRQSLSACVNSGASFYEIEGRVRELCGLFEGALLETLSQLLEARDEGLPRPGCPKCGRSMHRNRPEPLTLQLLEGPLSLRRRYWQCRRCSRTLSPLDHQLRLPVEGEVAPRFGQDLCRLGGELPYKTAASLLEAVTGREVDAATIQKQVQRDGTALVELEREEAAACSQALPRKERRELLRKLPKLRRAPRPSGVLVVELDGVMTNLGADKEVKLEHQGWELARQSALDAGQPFDKSQPSLFRETLNARLYRLEDLVEKRTKSGKIRRTLLDSETITVVNDPAFFRDRLYAVAEDWKFDKYRRTVVLGDGAIFQRQLADFLQAYIEILDFMHAKGHVYECARALYGEGSDAARGWGKRWSDSLYEQGPLPLLGELERLEKQEWGEEAARKLRNLSAYVREHQLRMRYPEFRRQGLPIGSGAIESANRQVVGDRCKRSGMRWGKKGLQSLLSLRASLLSGNWEVAFAAIRERRCRQPLPVTPELEAPLAAAPPTPAPDNPRPRRAPARQPPRPGRRPAVPEWKLGQRIEKGLLRRGAKDTLLPGNGPNATSSGPGRTQPRKVHAPRASYGTPGVALPFGEPKAP